MDVVLEKILVRLPSSGQRLFSLEHLEIKTGERVLVRGPSGRGKTTLLHLIAGLFPPEEGHVRLGGTDLSSLSESARSRLRRESLAIVFQKLNLLPHLTALENVLLALRSGDKKAERAEQALSRLRMKDYAQTMAGDLSLGEQQRVAVARVIAGKPSLVLADEPTSSLDDANAKAVCDALFDVSSDSTLIVVSHDHRIDSRFGRVIDFDQIITVGKV